LGVRSIWSFGSSVGLAVGGLIIEEPSRRTLTNALAQENRVLGADRQHLARTLLADPSRALHVLGTLTPTRSRGGAAVLARVSGNPDHRAPSVGIVERLVAAPGQNRGWMHDQPMHTQLDQRAEVAIAAAIACPSARC
jgi:hypothetical protein